jgi:Retinoic acid induced 16-like protein.
MAIYQHPFCRTVHRARACLYWAAERDSQWRVSRTSTTPLRCLRGLFSDFCDRDKACSIILWWWVVTLCHGRSSNTLIDAEVDGVVDNRLFARALVDLVRRADKASEEIEGRLVELLFGIANNIRPATYHPTCMVRSPGDSYRSGRGVDSSDRIRWCHSQGWVPVVLPAGRLRSQWWPCGRLCAYGAVVSHRDGVTLKEPWEMVDWERSGHTDGYWTGCTVQPIRKVSRLLSD